MAEDRGADVPGPEATRAKESEPDGDGLTLPDTLAHPGEAPAGEGARAWPAVPGYEILGELGRGGMGVVYRARQLRLGRVVALKMVLRGAHAGRDELARFRTEAAAAARLQHPNIVQVHEVGECDGLPYFSLEFCAGGSLAEKLDGTPWQPQEAASLLRTLARAAHAAHRHGIIHRDLKPANVLLAEDGTPKITDFGLAKRVGEAGQTASGDVLGTPSYMAPEQAAGKTREVGPAADVYALGAILYELLTGRPPFKAATALDTLLQVMEQEPVPPGRLGPKTPRDLEVICLQCLGKDPRRRYAGAGELADDLGRFLAGETIRARPAGRPERAWRWCRRNPAVAALLAVVVCLTAAGLGLVGWQWRRAVDREQAALAARHEAEEARRAAEVMAGENARLAEKERAARVAAQRMEARATGESRRARQSLDFLVSLFRVSDPMDFGGYVLRSGNERGAALTAKDLLDRGAKKLSAELKDEPLVRASLLMTVGDVYRGMGLYDAAAPRLQEAVDLRRKHLGETHPEYARSLYHLAWLHLDRGDYDRAETLLRRALAAQEKKLPADAPATDDTRMLLAWVLTMYGDPGSLPLWKGVVAARTKRYGGGDRRTILAKGGLAAAYLEDGRMMEALPLILEAIPYAAGRDGGQTNVRAASLFQQGVLKSSLRLHGLAQRSFEESLELAKRQLGANHHYLAIILHELAGALAAQDKWKEAERRLAECMRVIRSSVGLEHPRAAIAIRSYAAILERVNRRREARALWQEALAANEKRSGRDNRFRFFYLAPCARLDGLCGKPDVASARAREALRLLPRAAGKESLKVVELRDLGWALFRTKGIDPGLAEACLRQAARLCREHKTVGRDYLAGVLAAQGWLLHARGRYREALPVLEEAEAKGRGTAVVRGWDGRELYRQLGDVYLAAGRLADATRCYRQSLDLLRRQPGAAEGVIVDAHINLAGPDVEARRWAAAARTLREAAERRRDGKTTYYDNPLHYLALVQQAAGEHTAALRSADLLAANFADHPSAHVRLRALRGLLVVAPEHPRVKGEGLCLLDDLRLLGEQLPGNAAVAEVTALAMLRLNEPADVEAVVKLLPSKQAAASPFWTLCRAWAAALQGRCEEARELRRQAGQLARAWEATADSIDARAACKWYERLEYPLLDAEVGKLLGPAAP